ncbi:GNAT family N-acetyltransferase [Tenacibaculum amylolyticum]|uniref:GNAT family N-acetyltransferase n=1 Tax=Tenacibaculum amylolyticum TaxID=104269 RepID=UPI003895F0D4
MTVFKTTTFDIELREILALQQQNLPKNLTEQEKQTQGFVTVKHDFSILKKMHEVHPHIIAVSDNSVIGYALSMSKSFKEEVPVLIPMFRELEKLSLDPNFILMGQVCIDKEYRGKGIFRGLYAKMKEVFTGKYSSIITEIDALNTRSVQAHTAIGFTEVYEYESGNQLWKIVRLEV